MTSTRSTTAPKIAAGCLLYHILNDEGIDADDDTISVLEETLQLMKLSAEESASMTKHAVNQSRTNPGRLTPGDKVEGNYCMEGTFYRGVIVEVSDENNSVVIKYDDDSTTETLTLQNVRSLEPAPNAISPRTARLSDDEALGIVNTDEQFLFEDYDLTSTLAELHARFGRSSKAAALYQEASNLAMDAGKMKSASMWSLRATELVD